MNCQEKDLHGVEQTSSTTWHSMQEPNKDLIRAGSANMYRRTRKPNYSHEETMVLLEQIEIHRHILFGKATNHQRTELWNFIADAVNALPHSAGRTIEELKHRWKDISHRARLSARSISQAKANNEQVSVAPSLYFDIIMRILGEDFSEASEYSMLSFSDSQNSSSRFIEDGQVSPGKFEVDVKPDINAINRFLGGDMASHSSGINPNSIPPSCNITQENQSMLKSSNSSSQNLDNSQNSAYQYSPSPNTKFSGSSQRKYTPHQLHHNLDANDHSLFNSVNPSSGHNEYRPTSGKFSPWRPQTQASVIRPMRLDPVTQEVSEVDGHNLNCHMSESGNSFKMTASVIHETLDNKKETAEKSFTAQNHQHHSKKRKLDSTHVSMETHSIDELSKLYMIKKIQMVSQRTHCFHLLERKLKCEINLLKQHAALKSVSSQLLSSRDARMSKKHKYNDKEDDNEIRDNLMKFDSKTDSEDENCEENRDDANQKNYANNGGSRLSDSDDSSSCSSDDSNHAESQSVFKHASYDGVRDFVLGGNLVESEHVTKNDVKDTVCADNR